MKKLDYRKFFAHSYFLLTVLGLIFYFGPLASYAPIFLLGCHTTVLPIYGMLIAANREFAAALMVFWILYVIAFIASYLVAWLRKQYLPLVLIALIDALFAIAIVYAAILSVGFEPEEILILIGALYSLLVFAGLLFGGKLRKTPVMTE